MAPLRNANSSIPITVTCADGGPGSRRSAPGIMSRLVLTGRWPASRSPARPRRTRSRSSTRSPPNGRSARRCVYVLCTRDAVTSHEGHVTAGCRACRAMPTASMTSPSTSGHTGSQNRSSPTNTHADEGRLRGTPLRRNAAGRVFARWGRPMGTSATARALNPVPPPEPEVQTPSCRSRRGPSRPRAGWTDALDGT